MNAKEYYAYIESLAALHALVRHSGSAKHYFRGELEEFYTDLRNRVNFPAVIAEGFELSYTSGDKTRETSFIVAAAYRGNQNWPAIYEALDLCERIGDEFLRRMVADGEEASVICANIEPLSAVTLLNEQHLYVGIRYTVRISEAFDETVDEEQWTDLA